MLDVEGESTAPRNASVTKNILFPNKFYELAECCQLAFENNTDLIIKPEYLPITFVKAKEDFILKDDEDNKYFYYVGIFDVEDSEPIEIPFTIAVIINTIYKQYFFETILKFFEIKIDIEKEDELQEQIKALTKTLQESELKAKVNIRFLEEKELFSFKLADLIISKKE